MTIIMEWSSWRFSLPTIILVPTSFFPDFCSFLV